MPNKSPTDAVIVSACRTPIGKFKGGLSQIRPDDLLALVLKEAAKNIDLAQVDEIIAGCANQAGEDNRNVARMATVLAKFPFEIPAVTVNRLCASGLEAVIQASRAIRLGDAQVMIAGGVESMSRAPFVKSKFNEQEIYDTSIGWRFPNPAMAAIFELQSMGQTAENLAKKHKISREAQDKFALHSHQKAVLAQKNSLFDKEILKIQDQKNLSDTIERDESPRESSNLEKLASLKPIFKPIEQGGTVTAGSSSSLNDGAAALCLVSRQYAKENSLKIMARILGSASAGVEPNIMGIGPVYSTGKLLKKLNLQISDIDIIELNEAFAAQALSVIQELNLDINKVNLNGGAIALGHPLGCSGARILVTLLNVLEQQNKTLGLATLCVGVGQGLSLIVERES